MSRPIVGLAMSLGAAVYDDRQIHRYQIIGPQRSSKIPAQTLCGRALTPEYDADDRCAEEECEACSESARRWRERRLGEKEG